MHKVVNTQKPSRRKLFNVKLGERGEFISEKLFSWIFFSVSLQNSSLKMILFIILLLLLCGGIALYKLCKCKSLLWRHNRHIEFFAAIRCLKDRHNLKKNRASLLKTMFYLLHLSQLTWPYISRFVFCSHLTFCPLTLKGLEYKIMNLYVHWRPYNGRSYLVFPPWRLELVSYATVCANSFWHMKIEIFAFL